MNSMAKSRRSENMFAGLRKRFRFNTKITEVIGAPVAGEAVSSAVIEDAAYRSEMLGKGMAIKPIDGKLYAPVDGMVTLIFETKHALTITSECGAEILIHIGLDTVSLEGMPFVVHVQKNDLVKRGDLLAEFDMNMIREAKFDNIIPIVILNSECYKKIKCFTGNVVKPGEDIIHLIKSK